MSEPREGENDDARVSTTAAAVIGVVFTLAAAGLADARTALSVGLGAGTAVLNLVTLRAILSSMLASAAEADEAAAAASDTGETGEPPPSGPAAKPVDDGDESATGATEEAAKARGRRGGAAWGVFAVLKIFVLFGGIWLLLTRGWVSAIPLVIGYGALPLGITASAVLASLRPAPRRRR